MKFLVSNGLLLSLLISCATQPVKTTYKDVDDIKPEDFKTKKQVKYKKSDDYFSAVKSEYSEALNEESLERVFKYDGDIDISNPLDKITELCYKGEYQKAHEEFKSFTKVYLENPIYWNQVGTCFLLEGNRRKALLFFNKALSLRGNYAPALNNLGVMYMKERDYSRALVAFERARKSSDFNKTPRFNLANLYLNFGLYDKAISQANVLYNSSNKDIDVLNVLGTAYLMKNEFKKSLDYFSKIDGDFLELPSYGINYSLALYLAGKKEQALDVFDDVNRKKLGKWKTYLKDVGKLIGAKK